MIAGQRNHLGAIRSGIKRRAEQRTARDTLERMEGIFRCLTRSKNYLSALFGDLILQSYFRNGQRTMNYGL